MLRFAPLAGAALLTAAAGDAVAPGFYVAIPAAKASKAALMTRATPWRLQGGVYVADRAPERAEVLCQLVARDAGALSGFSAGGVSFDADALAKCNAHARPAPAPAADVAVR